MKQLTIAVPVYNGEAYLERCLDSMAGYDPRLEIIVVNDGSTDKTESIVRRYTEAHPEQVRLISKENGGHGSGINRAVREAEGRYFKAVDADDWIVTKNLSVVLDALERTDADAVIMGYDTIHAGSGQRIAGTVRCRCAGRDIDLEQLMEVYDEAGGCCTFHGLAYRTAFYREHDISLSEGIFYEDQEYAALPFAYVDKVLILPVTFYQYEVGREDQSISARNQVKRIGHIETVTRRIASFMAEQGLTGARADYFDRHLALVAVSYYATALVKDPDRRAGRSAARRFRENFARMAPAASAMTDRKYRILWFLHWIHMPADLYENAKGTAFYRLFRKIWLRQQSAAQ